MAAQVTGGQTGAMDAAMGAAGSRSEAPVVDATPGEVAAAETAPGVEVAGEGAPASAPAAKPGELAKATLAKARREAARQRQLAEQRASTEARTRVASLEQENARLKAENERRAPFESAFSDPSKALDAARLAGVTARQLAEEAIRDGTPEAKLAAFEAAMKADNAKLRAELEELRNQRKSETEAAQKAKARSDFHATITADAYPHLHRLDEDSREALCERVFVLSQKRGYTPTDLEVLSHVESQLASKYGSGTTAKKPAGVGNTAATPGAKQSPPSRTVTAQLAGSRYTLPANFDELDDMTQRKELARMYQHDSRKG